MFLFWGVFLCISLLIDDRLKVLEVVFIMFFLGLFFSYVINGFLEMWFKGKLYVLFVFVGGVFGIL